MHTFRLYKQQMQHSLQNIRYTENVKKNHLAN